MLRTMTGGIFGAAAIAAMLIGGAGSAKATIVSYDLTVDNCTGGCNPGLPGTSMGTVTLNDFGSSGTVLVTVDLVSPLWFVNTGLDGTIDFNLASILSGVSTTSFKADGVSTTDFALQSGTAGTNHFDGFGDFMYAIDLTTGNGAANARDDSPLTFNVVATGITVGSFTANANNAIFGVDVYNTVNGNTGPIGTTGSTPTPEPITSSLVGTGLVGLFFLGRRRAARKA